MVGWRGVEPPIPHGRWILSPLHIPVLPPPHKGGVLGTGRHPWLFCLDHHSSITAHTPLSPAIRLVSQLRTLN